MENISCTRCHAPIPAQYANTPNLVPCPSCHSPVRIDLFPAFFRGLRPGKPGESLSEDQAGCFYHPQKKAVVPCDHCGRFLCALCDVDFGNRHLCPACLDLGRKKGELVNLDRHRVTYDGAALRIALLPVITVWLTAVTAPLALYVAIRYWNAPRSLIHRTRTRFILAIGLSGIQILAWAVWIGSVVSRRW